MARLERRAGIALALVLAACGSARPVLGGFPRCDLAVDALDAWDLGALADAGELDGAEIWIEGGFRRAGASTCGERHCGPHDECGRGEYALVFVPSHVGSHGTHVRELWPIGSIAGSPPICSAPCRGSFAEPAVFDADSVQCPVPRGLRTFVRARIRATAEHRHEMEVRDLCVLPHRVRPEAASIEQFVHESTHDRRELELRHRDVGGRADDQPPP